MRCQIGTLPQGTKETVVKDVLLYLITVAIIGGLLAYAVIHNRFPSGNLNCLCN